MDEAPPLHECARKHTTRHYVRFKHSHRPEHCTTRFILRNSEAERYVSNHEKYFHNSIFRIPIFALFVRLDR